MVAAGAIGTTADMVYGYFVECAEFRTNAEQETESSHQEPIRPSSKEER
jgi:hypothetical protein